MTDNNDIPFFERVNAWSYAKKIQGRRVSDKARSIMLHHRSTLRRAQRFVIDDDAVRLACHLSHERDRLEPFTFLARLPYVPMWIEYNLHAKIREFDRMGRLRKSPGDLLRHVPHTMGLLLDLDRGSETRWNCHVFVSESDPNVKQDWVFPDFLAYVFDPACNGQIPVRGSAQWNAPTLSMRPDFPRQKADIEYEMENGQIITRETEIDPEFNVIGVFEHGATSVGAPDFFANKTAVIVEPWWDAWHHTAEDRARLDHMAFIDARELTGMLRWLICLLAAINGLPRDVAARPTRPGHRLIGANVIPYLGAHNLSIKIPKDGNIRHVALTLERSGRNQRRRWHRVIGHWRIIDAGRNPRGIWCKHMPALIDDQDPHLGLCEKCQMLIRWIPQHTRGDPEIGIVDHPTYTVTT